jgi:hypothetical protein
MGAVHLLPGTTFSNVTEKESYDSEGRTVLTLPELERWLALQIEGGPRHRVTGVDSGPQRATPVGMISSAIAPIQLPFSPRPISTELLSSWLLRVAAANLVSPWELLQGFESRYGRVLTNVTVDYSLGDAAVAALSRFCRVAPEKIRALDLRPRSPHLSPALLLGFRFQNALLVCPRYRLRRVRYAFCPLCIASQRVLHVRWDWSVACLIHCAVHRTPLLDGCPACGEPDPLTFSGLNLSPIRLRQFCAAAFAAGVPHS